MFKLSNRIFLIFLILLGTKSLEAQSLGFGCFGFVGGYAGYSYQEYEPGSLNDAITYYNSAISNSSSQTIPEFRNASGYRFGINFFRAKFSGVLLSLKGYYEILSENKSFTYNQNSTTQLNSELDLDLKSWNVGLDFGIPITNLLSWKIVEGDLHFNTSKVTYKPNLNDNSSNTKFSNDSPELGYSISTGLIFTVIENFVCIEGTAGYKFFKIKRMTDGEGNNFQLQPYGSRETEDKDFIKAGGFNASVQLNVGFPLQ